MEACCSQGSSNGCVMIESLCASAATNCEENPEKNESYSQTDKDENTSYCGGVSEESDKIVVDQNRVNRI